MPSLHQRKKGIYKTLTAAKTRVDASHFLITYVIMQMPTA